MINQEKRRSSNRLFRPQALLIIAIAFIIGVLLGTGLIWFYGVDQNGQLDIMFKSITLTGALIGGAVAISNLVINQDKRIDEKSKERRQYYINDLLPKYQSFNIPFNYKMGENEIKHNLTPDNIDVFFRDVSEAHFRRGSEIRREVSTLEAAKSNEEVLQVITNIQVHDKTAIPFLIELNSFLIYSSIQTFEYYLKWQKLIKVIIGDTLLIKEDKEFLINRILEAYFIPCLSLLETTHVKGVTITQNQDGDYQVVTFNRILKGMIPNKEELSTSLGHYKHVLIRLIERYELPVSKSIILFQN